MKDIFTKIYLESIIAQYEPPYTQQDMRQNGYDQATIQKLKNDPAHSWRMKTGLQLIHRQLTRSELIRIWKNWQRMTDDQKIVSDQKCIQLFGCTNQQLYNYLIPQYTSQQPGRENIHYPPIKEQINQNVINNIKDNFVYAARNKLYKKLEGSYTSQWSGQKGNIFVTPFKGIASCFVIDHQQILDKFEKLLGKKITSCNFNYDVWNKSNKQLLNIINNINVTIQRSGIQTDKTINGTSTGYLYTIDFNKYKDRCHMFNKQMNSDVQFVIQGDVDYQKVQKITVSWTCNIQN